VESLSYSGVHNRRARPPTASFEGKIGDVRLSGAALPVGRKIGRLNTTAHRCSNETRREHEEALGGGSPGSPRQHVLEPGGLPFRELLELNIGTGIRPAPMVTAILNGIALVTNNRHDFLVVDGLKLLTEAP
jgi:hypothetical protein